MEINDKIIKKTIVSGIICNQKIKYKFKKKLICDIDNYKFKKKNLKEEIYYYINLNKALNDKKDIFEILKNLNIDIDVDIKINNLNDSQKARLYFVLQSMTNKEVYIYKNITKLIDSNNIKQFKKILEKIKSKGKTIIIEDKNVDDIFILIDDLFYINNNEIIHYDLKEPISSIERLLEKNLSPPNIHLITYLAKKQKNVKLFYHNDVRDIIKDIYKHV